MDFWGRFARGRFSFLKLLGQEPRQVTFHFVYVEMAFFPGLIGGAQRFDIWSPIFANPLRQNFAPG